MVLHGSSPGSRQTRGDQTMRLLVRSTVFCSRLNVAVLLVAPVISAHSAQVARFLVIDSHAEKARVHPSKIVEPLNFAPLHFSLNNSLRKR